MEAAFQQGFASALLDVLFNRVTSVVIAEFKKVLQSDAALEKLETSILRAQNLLRQVDTTEMQGQAQTVVQNRVDKLTSLYYDADDLMGDILLLLESKSMLLEQRPLLGSILASPRRWGMARAITKLQEKLDAILEELKLLELELSSQPKAQMGQSEPNDRHKLILEKHFFGRKDDMEIITQELLSCSFERQGVSIMGMDGIGKTRLARIIQNDARVTSHFSLILWVDVHGNGCFNLDETIKQLDEIQAKELSDNDNVLITFDNLLEVNLVVWYKFWNYITNKEINGKKYRNIKFLITTFSSKVVETTRTSSHHLQPLSEDDCKKLIVATAESLNRNLCESHFEHAAILSKNCGGLPSVAIILGIMLSQYDVEKVRNILRCGLWDSSVFYEEIFPALKPCYTKFQAHLKWCLAYFSLFPHNYSFTIDELVHLWVGEGFIQEPQGKDNFKEFLGMSILRCSDQLGHKGIPTYELNQCSHKFAQLAASKTYLRLAQGVPASYINTRHLSLAPRNECFSVWDDLKKFRRLRTVFAMFESISDPIPRSAFKKLTRLRVLSLRGSDVCELPDSINCLKQLRYLNISDTNVRSLPETLCELRNLQFLKIVKDDGILETFPTNFKRLTNMIHIDWGVREIRHMGLPSHIGNLSTLQTLPLFPVGSKVGHLITELKDMNHLQGSIRIENLENVKDRDSAITAGLQEKSFTRIELEWKKSQSTQIAKEVLDCLKPGENLKELKITKYHGDMYPEWMTGSLPKLEEMHLQNCPNIDVLPQLGLLPNLKLLILEEIKKVTNVDHHFFRQGHFPKLESLTFIDMEQLQTWNVGLETDVMPPQLQVLKFNDCPNLITISSLKQLSSLEKLTIQRCDELSSLPDLPISLNTLIIEECDLLRDSCIEGGQDWIKVDCIPNVEINYQKIATSASNNTSTSDQTI
ncbi:putative disease resistance protein RGA3 [Silene latifolia]|uniref:putative disease resistance protein RGA3 n=1 Tax=Silene latifolia TaxID=37657 RepID=UPI003D775CE0